MKLVKLFMFLGLTVIMVACNQTSVEESRAIKSVTVGTTGQDTRPSDLPSKPSDLPSKPTDLTSNHLLVVNNQLYFYNEREDEITLVFPEGSVWLTVPSPSKKAVAVIKGQDSLLILDHNMRKMKEFHLQDFDEQDVGGVGDLRWLGEDRMLIGLDYNANVRGYYAVELTQESFAAKQVAITKTGAGVMEVLDPKAEHVLYHYPNERYFSEIDKPAIYVNEQMIYQGSEPTEFIGKLSVNTASYDVLFPVTQGSQTMFVIGKYNPAKFALEDIEQHALELSDHELLYDYVLDSTWQEGYLFSQHEEERWLYKWSRKAAPSLTFLRRFFNV